MSETKQQPQYLAFKAVRGYMTVYAGKAVVTSCSKCKETVTLPGELADQIKVHPDPILCQFCIDTSALSEEEKKYVESFKQKEEPESRGGFTISIK